MKHLKTFETKADYKSAKKNHQLDLPNVSLVKADNSVYITSSFVSKYEAEAGDIVVYSKEIFDKYNSAIDETAKASYYAELLASVKYVKPEMFDAEMAKTYVPDAIVAVPYSHTDDGTVKAMSLQHMSAADPESGQTGDGGIVWGANVDISGIKNYSGGAVVSSPDLGDASGLSSASPTYLPSDAFTALEVKNSDTEFYWNSTGGNHAPCPYKSDGSFNPRYAGVQPDGITLTDNCFGDMDGASNTKAIINTLDKKYLNKTLMAETVTNERTVQTDDGVSTNNFPAAICCQRYKSVLKPNAVTVTDSGSGDVTINYGDWYFPSAGEVSYTIVSKGRISYALSRINAALPGTAAAWVDNWLWSSSEKFDSAAWYLNPSDGSVIVSSKYYYCRVRAFAAF